MEKYLPCYEKSFFERTEKNVSCEISLPEYLPNASRIVKVSTRACADECEAVKDSLYVRGHINFFVIYLSDFKDKLKCASASADFSHTFPAKGIEDAVKDSGYFDLNCSVSEERGQLMSPRKLGVSCKVSVCAEAVTVKKTEIFDTEESDTVHKLCKKTELLELTKLPKCEVTFEDNVPLDEGMPEITEMVFSDCGVSSVSAYCRDGKVNYNGTLELCCLYLAQDEDGEQYISFEKELDFNGTIDAGDIPDGAFIVTRAAVLSLSTDPVQNNYGESSMCSVSAGIVLSSKVFYTAQEELLCDAFCTGYECDCELKNIVYDSFVCGTDETVRVNEDIRANLGSITDIVSKSISVSVVSTELLGKTPVFNLRAALRLLGTNEQGGLESVNTAFNFKAQSEHELEFIPDRCRFDAEAYVKKCDCKIENGEIKCEITLGICCCAYGRKTVRTVTALEIDTECEFCRDKSEYILYYPCDKDTVWSCAKKYKVSPKALLAVNGMELTENDFGSRKAVVIPRSDS